MIPSESKPKEAKIVYSTSPHPPRHVRPLILAIVAALIAGNIAALTDLTSHPFANALWLASITFLVVTILFRLNITLGKIRYFAAHYKSIYWWSVVLAVGSLFTFTLLMYYMLSHPQPSVYGDAIKYLGVAMGLRAGEIELAPQLAHYYPIILALFVPLDPAMVDPLAAVRITQAALTALLGPLVYGIVRQLHGTRLAALTAAFVCWLYGPFYHAAGTPHMEAVYTLALVAAAWTTLRLRRGQIRPAIWTGAFAAFALLIRAYYTWYLVLLGGILGGDRVFQAWRARRSWATTVGTYNARVYSRPHPMVVGLDPPRRIGKCFYPNATTLLCLGAPGK